MEEEKDVTKLSRKDQLKKLKEDELQYKKI